MTVLGSYWVFYNKKKNSNDTVLSYHLVLYPLP